jgi:hypothetical protein
LSKTYSSHGLSDSGGNSDGVASTRVASSAVTRASRAGGGGNLNESDSLSLGRMASGSYSVSGVFGRLGLVIASLTRLGDLGIGTSLGLY